MRATDLSPDEVAALQDALDDERKACAAYDGVVQDFGEARPFVDIRDAEQRHVLALEELFERHHLPLPQNSWPTKADRYDSFREACQAAIDGEIESERLYRRLLQVVRKRDIRAVFKHLRDASQLRHLPAFQRCIAPESVAAGGEPEQGLRRKR
jgi:rubrerythrin